MAHLTSGFIRSFIKSNQSSPARQLQVQSVFPFAFPAALSALLIAAVIARPLLVALGIFSNLWIFLAALIHGFYRWTMSSTTKAGFHAARPLTKFQSSVEEALRGFDSYKAPFYYACGYFCTILPFFLFNPPRPNYERQWIQASDGQPIYLDWLLPTENVRGIVIMLHGVNGGTDANYVKDVSVRLAGRGFAVACMINRGLGDAFVEGPPERWFSAARICDVKAAVESVGKLVDSSNQAANQ